MKQILLIRCPKCKTENYGPAVAENICVWCEYEATEKDVDNVNVVEYNETR